MSKDVEHSLASLSAEVSWLARADQTEDGTGVPSYTYE